MFKKSIIFVSVILFLLFATYLYIDSLHLENYKPYQRQFIQNTYVNIILIAIGLLLLTTFILFITIFQEVNK